MPFFDRPLVTDRPTVIDPVITSDDSEEEQSQEEDIVDGGDIETLGEGGGKVVHGLEFEEGQEDIIKSSNLVAILATGQEEGKLYSDVFKNAAFQLAEVREIFSTVIDEHPKVSKYIKNSFMVPGTEVDSETALDQFASSVENWGGEFNN